MAQSSNVWDAPVQQEIPSTTLSTTSQHHQGASANVSHTRRIYFWAAAGFAWAVWALAVTAAAHAEWLVVGNDEVEVGLEAGNKTLLHLCGDAVDDGDDFDDEAYNICNLYRAFTAAQFTATVTCSIAVALLALAAFRPAVAKRASVGSLSIISSMLMIIDVVFQLLAAVLARVLVTEVEDVAYAGVVTIELGLTFWIGVAGLVLALFTSVCLCVTDKHAGDGPFLGAGRLWVASGVAWMVWALAVTAAAHSEWLVPYIGDVPVDVEGSGLGPGNGDLFESCKAIEDLGETDELDLLCDLYRGFTATQFAATAVCSLAVALLALAAFRPAAAGCASVKSLANAAGAILIIYVVCQVGAVVLAHLFVKEYERIATGLELELEFGATFWLVVAGLVLTVIASYNVFVGAKLAENGPFYGRGDVQNKEEEMKASPEWESA